MKMYLGNTPLKSMKVGTNTDDATFIASDLQAGKTGYVKGRKVTGTGKCFEFATYGYISSNDMWPIPTDTINVVHISSLDYPTQQLIALNNMKDMDFSSGQTVSNVMVNGTTYPVQVVSADNMFTVVCDITTNFEIFYGKDNYV